LTSFACPQRRIEKVQAWLAAPNQLEVDKDAEKGPVIEIDMKLKKKRPRERFRGRFAWGAASGVMSGACVIHKILQYIGVDAEPLRITLAPWPLLWDGTDAQAGEGDVAAPDWDQERQAAPVLEIDQRVSGISYQFRASGDRLQEMTAAGPATSSRACRRAPAG